MGGALELFGGQFGEPPLDEVQPRGTGRREVKLEAGVRKQPAFDLRGLVRGCIVEHEVHVEVLGDSLVDGVEELLELDRAVAGVQLADHLSGREIQRGVQVAGSGLPVVMEQRRTLSAVIELG